MYFKYKNLSNRSGVVAYEIGPDGIKVRFKNGAEYLYPLDTITSGSGLGDIKNNTVYHQSQMAALADHGEYLNRFINENKPDYVRLNGPEVGYLYQHKSLHKDDLAKMSSIHSKYIFRGRNTLAQDQLKDALKVKNYNEWVKARNIQKKFR